MSQILFFRHFTCINILFSSWPCEGATLIIPISQMQKLRHQGVLTCPKPHSSVNGEAEVRTHEVWPQSLRGLEGIKSEQGLAHHASCHGHGYYNERAKYDLERFALNSVIGYH